MFGTVITLRRVLAAGVTLIAIVAWACTGSVFSPTCSIRAAILRSTPIGSTSSTVRLIVEQKGWLVSSYAGNTGFLKQEAGEPSQIIGTTSIRGNLGDWGPMNVSAYWGFDSNGHLKDVWVWRTFDTP